MSVSNSPGSFSSASSPPPTSNFLRDKLKAKLAPFRDAAIGYVEALQEASDMVISNINPQDEDGLELDDFYGEAEKHIAFYAVSQRKKNSRAESIWSRNLDEELRLPAFFTSNCSKAVYCLLPQICKILEDDADFLKVSWSREYINPGLIMFDVDEAKRQLKRPLPFLAHDFITITCADKQRFVLDVTGDQFGLEEWFYTTKDYRKLYLDVLPPEPTSEATKAAHVENEDHRNPALARAVSEAIEEAQQEWARFYICWRDIYLLSEEKQMELGRSLGTKVRAKVLAELRR